MSSKPTPKGTPKGSGKGTPRGTPGKGTPGKGTPKGTPRGGTPQRTPTPSITPKSEPIPTVVPVDPNTPFFCCTNNLPPIASFPPPLVPFYTYIITRFPLTDLSNPPPITTLPPTKTYFRFSHLSLSTFQETHRYFLSLDPQGEGTNFVEGSEEEVLGKAGASGEGDRKQNVMILSQNARCVEHAPMGKEGFWYVLMRVDGLDG